MSDKQWWDYGFPIFSLLVYLLGCWAGASDERKRKR